MERVNEVFPRFFVNYYDDFVQSLTKTLHSANGANLPCKIAHYSVGICYQLKYIHDKAIHNKTMIIVTGHIYIQYSSIETISYNANTIIQFAAELVYVALSWHVDGIIPRLITQERMCDAIYSTLGTTWAANKI